MCARALHESGRDVSVLSYLDARTDLLDGIRTEAFGGRKFGYGLRVLGKCAGRRPIVYDSVGMARGHPPLVRKAALWMHGTEVWDDMRPDYGRSIRRAGLVLCNTRYTLERHEAAHGRLSTARVCWLATEQDAAPDATARFDGPPSVLIVGRIETSEGRKGHAELLASWPRIVAVVPAARLVIAGGGSGLEAMREQVRRSPVAANIDLLGFVSEAEMPALFQAAHVFAMPSRQEGFGIAYIEAMRYGVPVIASLQDAGQEINVDGVTGFNIDLDRPEQFPDRLIQLIRDPVLAAEMGAAGHRRWHEHFRYSRFAERFLAHWAEFLDISENGLG